MGRCDSRHEGSVARRSAGVSVCPASHGSSVRATRESAREISESFEYEYGSEGY